jgi:hypothetical protein
LKAVCNYFQFSHLYFFISLESLFETNSIVPVPGFLSRVYSERKREI